MKLKTRFFDDALDEGIARSCWQVVIPAADVVQAWGRQEVVTPLDAPQQFREEANRERQPRKDEEDTAW